MSFRELSFDALELREDWQDELRAWVRTLGVNPEDVRNQVCITIDGDRYELHLSRYVRDKQGDVTVDCAMQVAVSEPLVIDLGTEPTWPEWLGTKFQVETTTAT